MFFLKLYCFNLWAIHRDLFWAFHNSNSPGLEQRELGNQLKLWKSEKRPVKFLESHWQLWSCVSGLGNLTSPATTGNLNSSLYGLPQDSAMSKHHLSIGLGSELLFLGLAASPRCFCIWLWRNPSFFTLHSILFPFIDSSLSTCRVSLLWVLKCLLAGHSFLGPGRDLIHWVPNMRAPPI